MTSRPNFWSMDFSHTLLEVELTRVPKQLKRNKAFRDTIGGLHIVALDGTEPFRSTSIHCNECLVYHVKTKDGSITHYVHRQVVAQKVGTELKPILAVEKILPVEESTHFRPFKDTRKKGDKTEGHEGELTAGKRLVFALEPDSFSLTECNTLHSFKCSGSYFLGGICINMITYPTVSDFGRIKLVD